MKKILLFTIASIVLLSSQAYAVHPRLKARQEGLNDAQKFEQQLLQRRNEARKERSKKISGTIRHSGNSGNYDKGSSSESGAQASSSSGSSWNGLYSSSMGSGVSSGMFVK